MKRVALVLALLMAACGPRAKEPSAPVQDAAASAADAGAAATDAARAAGVDPAVSPPPPPEPEGVTGDPTGRCSGGTAEWQANDETVPGFTPIRPGADTETAVWSCKAGGRRLVVRHETGSPGGGVCSGAYYGAVSVWVDGVKAVNHEFFNDYIQCATPDSVSILFSVALDRDGALTVCRLQGRSFQEKKVCERVPVRGTADPAYVPPGRHAALSLAARDDASPVCGKVLAQLSPVPRRRRGQPADNSLKAYWPRGVAAWTAGGQGGGPIVLDFDNDGRSDEVSRADYQSEGASFSTVAWRPAGSKAEPFVAGDLPASKPGYWERYSPYGVRPVVVDGRAYLYLWRQSGDLTLVGRDDYRSAGGLITRALLEAHSDGRLTIACTWGPKVRPEERL